MTRVFSAKRALTAQPARTGPLSRRRLLQGVAATSASGLLGSLTGCDRRSIPKDRQLSELWFSYGGKNRQVLEALVKRFNQEQSKIWVRAIFQGDYFENLAKLRTAAAAKAVPAMSHVVGEVIPYLAAANVLEPLDAYPGSQALGLVKALGQAGSWVGGGKKPLVALPFNRSTPIAYLNGDWLRESKVKPPTTWQGLLETAQIFTQRRGDRTLRWGFECPIDWWFWAALVGQAGGQIIEPDGEISLGGDAGVKAIELWQRLVTRERVMKPPPGRDYSAWEATNQDFLAARVGMIWTSTAFLKYLEQNAAFPVVAAPLPGEARRAVPTGGTFFVVMREAPPEQKQAAWEFLRWMMAPKQTIEWATSTGYMPVAQAAVEQLEASGYYKQHPNDRVALDQLEVAFQWPWSRELFRIQREIVQPRLEQTVLTGTDARQAMDAARALAKGELAGGGR